MSAVDTGRDRSLEALVERIVDGHPRSIARAITEIEDQTARGESILQQLPEPDQPAAVVGITGPPGVGKSTLINALITELRARELRVGVLSVDPSSPVSGGAVLGDRIRMARHASDPGVFIRSLASRGQIGGLCRTIDRVIRLVHAAGFDLLIVETVGTGQVDVAITEVANTNVALFAPGLGDEIQALKAGILEVADILVVNRADSPHTRGTLLELESMLALRGTEQRRVPVLATIATTGEGVAELADRILDLASSD
ncbi:MAG: methylmalonyl Co-A mutase-associated GTPase MeaB [Ectothiorhodospiraceae bacterium]|nr:methylmalonyl Co-A mutase-associated GTPase MeaB [Ectothiorhodospiraceae bacterium]